MERSSGLICFLFSLEHALPGGSCSWLPWTASPSCQQTHSLPESITGLRPAHFMLCGCLHEAAHTQKNACLSLGHEPGCQVQAGECSKQLGEAESEPAISSSLLRGCPQVQKTIHITTPYSSQEWKHQHSPLHPDTVLGRRVALHGVEEAGEADWLQCI